MIPADKAVGFETKDQPLRRLLVDNGFHFINREWTIPGCGFSTPSHHLARVLQIVDDFSVCIGNYRLDLIVIVAARFHQQRAAWVALQIHDLLALLEGGHQKAAVPEDVVHWQWMRKAAYSVRYQN